VGGKLDRERALAVRREDDMGDRVADGHRVHELDFVSLNREHADRLVLSVGDERQVPARVDREPRRLLAHLDRGDVLGRARFQVDHVEFVVRRRLPRRPLLHPVERVGDDGEPLIRRDRQVHRGTDDGVHEGQADEDLRRFPIGDVNDRDRVLPRRAEDDLPGVIEAVLVVVPNDHQLRAGCVRERRKHQDEQKCGESNRVVHGYRQGSWFGQH